MPGVGAASSQSRLRRARWTLPKRDDMAQPPQITPGADLSALDARSREIFREIVESYLTTGEPVGSRTLSRQAGVGLSPASIRNTMADLAAMGLLDAPHAMAGRRPTQAGLRFFVDSLLQLGDVPEDEKREIDAAIAKARAQPQDVLGAASELLSGLAGGAGLVMTPERDAPVRHAEIVAIAPGQALMILVFEDNQVENRLIATPPDMPSSALVEATNFSTPASRAKPWSKRGWKPPPLWRGTARALDQTAASLVASGLVEWSGEDPTAGRAPIVRGRANLLNDAEAAADLEQGPAPVRRPGKEPRADPSPGSGQGRRRRPHLYRVRKPAFSLSGSSLIVAPYERRTKGRRRPGRHRTDEAELCAGDPGGGLYRARCGPCPGWARVRPLKRGRDEH